MAGVTGSDADKQWSRPRDNWTPTFETLEQTRRKVMLVPSHTTNRSAVAKVMYWTSMAPAIDFLRVAMRGVSSVGRSLSATLVCAAEKTLIEHRARYVQHIQKMLTQINIRLDSVISDIMVQTEHKILRRIISEEHNPEELAQLRNCRIKAKTSEIAVSLEGT